MKLGPSAEGDRSCNPWTTRDVPPAPVFYSICSVSFHRQVCGPFWDGFCGLWCMCFSCVFSPSSSCRRCYLFPHLIVLAVRQKPTDRRCGNEILHSHFHPIVLCVCSARIILASWLQLCSKFYSHSILFWLRWVPGMDIYVLWWTCQFLTGKFRLKLKKVGKTTRPFRYDLNQISYDYTVEVRNRCKGLRG